MVIWAENVEQFRHRLERLSTKHFGIRWTLHAVDSNFGENWDKNEKITSTGGTILRIPQFGIFLTRSFDEYSVMLSALFFQAEP